MSRIYQERVKKAIARELKSCPFCGCKSLDPSLDIQESSHGGYWCDMTVYCPQCYVGVGIGSFGFGSSPDFAMHFLLETWNKRDGKIEGSKDERDETAIRLAKMIAPEKMVSEATSHSKPKIDKKMKTTRLKSKEAR